MGVSAEPRVEGLAAILNEVRKELLDFGLRNPLLNYRLLKSRGPEVVAERPPDLYPAARAERKRFSFVPLEDRRENGVALSASAEEATLDDEADFDQLTFARRRLDLVDRSS